MQEKESTKTPGFRPFEIWLSGYRATGEHATASFQDVIFATTFDEAVAIHIRNKAEDWPEIYQHYECKERFVHCPVSYEHPLGRKLANVHSIWACQLHDNEKDARATCG